VKRWRNFSVFDYSRYCLSLSLSLSLHSLNNKVLSHILNIPHRKHVYSQTVWISGRQFQLCPANRPLFSRTILQQTLANRKRTSQTWYTITGETTFGKCKALWEIGFRGKSGTFNSYPSLITFPLFRFQTKVISAQTWDAVVFIITQQKYTNKYPPFIFN